MFKIISDSACDLSQAYIEKNNIDIVPLSVSFDGENYFLDGVDITRNECYQRMWTIQKHTLRHLYQREPLLQNF